MRAPNVLYKLNFPKDTETFDYFVCAIELAVSSPVTPKASQIYRALYHRLLVPPQKLEQTMEAALDNWWSSGNREFFEKMAGQPISSKPGMELFLSVIVQYLNPLHLFS